MSVLPLPRSTMATLPGRVIRPLMEPLGGSPSRPVGGYGGRLRLVASSGRRPPIVQVQVDPEAGARVAQQLTPRQRDVLEQLLQGASTKEICRALRMSEGTAKAHIAELLKTFNVESRALAIVEALRLGLIGVQTQPLH